MTSTRSHLEAEIRRLAPWYYLHELDGIRTDITPPCDHHGHRRVSLPDASRLWLEGKTVLDVGCNEGGYSFAAVAAGAARVRGFDCRAVNVEKARLVARVRGIQEATFEVSDTERWLAQNPGQTFDHVFLCGLLYHLPRPWETIARYCQIARNGVFLTCVLAGGDDGYTRFPEAENIAASLDPSEDSRMPNTTRTLVSEFARHAFTPVFIGENRTTEFWGGCSLFFQRSPLPVPFSREAEEDSVALHLVPSRDSHWSATVYNGSCEPVVALGTLVLQGAPSAPPLRQGPFPLRLSPRTAGPGAEPSLSLRLPFDVPPGITSIEASLQDERTGTSLARTRVSADGGAALT